MNHFVMDTLQSDPRVQLKVGRRTRTQSSLGYIRENKGALKVPFYFPLSPPPPLLAALRPFPLYSRLDWALNHL